VGAISPPGCGNYSPGELETSNSRSPVQIRSARNKSIGTTNIRTPENVANVNVPSDPKSNRSNVSNIFPLAAPYVAGELVFVLWEGRHPPQIIPGPSREPRGWTPPPPPSPRALRCTGNPGEGIAQPVECPTGEVGGEGGRERLREPLPENNHVKRWPGSLCNPVSVLLMRCTIKP